MIRSISAILAALAVLVVSATCTTAGCVLPGPIDASPSTKPEPACCASRHHHTNAAKDRPTRSDGEPCPLCRTTLLVGKSVDPSPHAPAALTLLPTLFLPTFAAADDHCPALCFIPTAWGAATPHDPPTLLALHCALLD